MALKSLEEGWIQWEELLARADSAGDIEAVLVRAARHTLRACSITRELIRR
jgi:hypothetical protein